MNIISVGIDVSKGKSTVSAYEWGDIVVMKPHNVVHTAAALSELADSLKQLDGDRTVRCEIRVVMEHTGRYWLPIAQVLHEAGLFVSAVNPKLIKDYGDNKLRKVKTERRVAADKALQLNNWPRTTSFLTLLPSLPGKSCWSSAVSLTAPASY
jgi:transposase